MKSTINPINTGSGIRKNGAGNDPFFKLFEGMGLEKPSETFSQNLMDRLTLENPELFSLKPAKSSLGFTLILITFLVLIILPFFFLLYWVGAHPVLLEWGKSNFKFVLPSYTKYLRYSYLVVGLFFLYALIEFFRFYFNREVDKA